MFKGVSFFVPANSDGVVTSQAIYSTSMRRSLPQQQSLQALLDKYAVKDKNHALRRAAHQGSVEDVETLIQDFGAEVNSKSESNGFTALDWAFFNDQMAAHGVFNTLCWLKADQSVLKPLLEKYSLDDEAEFPTKNVALARAMAAENEADIKVLVERYKADEDVAEQLLAAKSQSLR